LAKNHLLPILALEDQFLVFSVKKRDLVWKSFLENHISALVLMLFKRAFPTVVIARLAFPLCCNAEHRKQTDSIFQTKIILIKNPPGAG
jgi:hypothetical protein